MKSVNNRFVMKAIKLTLAFICILGGVIGAFFIINHNIGGTLPPPPDDTYKIYRDQFVKDWEQANDWNEQLFMSHSDMIQQLSTQFDTESLNDLNTKTATEIVYKKIFDEWKSSSCARNIIEEYSGAIKVIESKDNNATKDPNVQKIKNVYLTYTTAYSLAHQNIGLTPHFNGSSWNSYSSYSSSIENKMRSMLNNSNYKTYLSNIAEIKNGLNAIPNKLSVGRTRFYEGLANSIEHYYSRINRENRTDSELKALRNTIRKYEDEYKPSKRLSHFANDYAEDVAYNESREEYERSLNR